MCLKAMVEAQVAVRLRRAPRTAGIMMEAAAEKGILAIAKYNLNRKCLFTFGFGKVTSMRCRDSTK